MVARAWLCCVFLQLWASRPAGQLSTSPAWGPGAQVLARRPAGSAPAAVAAGSRSHSSGSRSCCQPPSSGRPGQERPALPGAGHTAGRSTGHRRLAALAARTAVAVWLSPAGLLAAVHRSGQWPPPSAVRRPAAGRRSPAGQSTRPAARSSRSPAAGRPAAAAAEAGGSTASSHRLRCVRLPCCPTQFWWGRPAEALHLRLQTQTRAPRGCSLCYHSRTHVPLPVAAVAAGSSSAAPAVHASNSPGRSTAAAAGRCSHSRWKAPGWIWHPRCVLPACPAGSHCRTARSGGLAEAPLLPLPPRSSLRRPASASPAPGVS
mmetsp:Transcript_16394/g.45674  ORF Transcript_16394/g.45674 Transcript_16394/m.45674 type:complete len:318 (+) Transcript_16394:237-1190(+)